VSPTDNNEELVPCNRERILVADDELSLRTLFPLLISHGLPNVKVELACDGRGAVEAFMSIHPAVILMDLSMPGMDGHEAAVTIQEFCRKNRWQMPAVIFCTGFQPPRTLSAIIGNGELHSSLHKPVSIAKLIAAIKASLAKI
jgi:CheY-like chemotaxis protein